MERINAIAEIRAKFVKCYQKVIANSGMSFARLISAFTHMCQ